MAGRDVRKEAPEGLYELRKRAVGMKLKGSTHREVASTLAVSVAASRLWWRKYREVGEEGLVLGRRGRPSGSCRTPTPAQEKAIQKAIVDKTPDQLKMDFLLWTRPVIAQYLVERYGIRLPVRTLRHYLKRWGFTPQSPKKVAFEQQPGEVREWIDRTCPRIARRAKAERADILWGDETGVSNQDHAGRGFAPKGKTPVARGMAKRVTTSIIPAIGNRGAARFMIYKDGLKFVIFIKFLARLINGAKRKIFLIVDILRVHKAKAVLAWVAERAERIELFHLPSCRPELNPDEYLNKPVEGKMRNLKVAATQGELRAQRMKVMKSAQRKRDIIRNRFKHPKVAYAV